ncbi:hypothetical protein ARAM_000064 [Aspergillus rambellii]|uniref:non-specific serine/threonine protein kinase n=1 Tax=Aspergillus rambellii TaxID=308745 RepID=A0A0F8W962_9EURO|nr:hypothetical protein ARAM_000064 [Aspergillus rambellii]
MPPPPLPPPFQTTSTSTSTPPPTLLTQGAEAHLYKTIFLSPSTPAALKIRPSKPYRHPILDRRLTRQRLLQEARCLAKLVREGVSVPALLGIDWESGNWLMMEWIEGVVVRVVLERWEVYMKPGGDLRDALEEEEESRVRGLMRRIGQSVQDEDRAVDLYVLERAFGSSHPRTEPFFEELLKGYRESYRGAVSALKRLEDVRLRGRKRSMIG